MAEVMAVLRDRSLYFLDSRTIGTTTAESVARELGVPALSRAVFLDHDPSRAAIEAALDEAARRSREIPVVAIAHPSAEVVDVLTRRLPELHAQGVSVYPVSRLLAAQSASNGPSGRTSPEIENVGFPAVNPD